MKCNTGLKWANNWVAKSTKKIYMKQKLVENCIPKKQKKKKKKNQKSCRKYLYHFSRRNWLFCQQYLFTFVAKET